MKIIYLLPVLLLSITGFSQIKLDSKIIVTVGDSASIYQKVKTSLVKNDFIVKDLPQSDTILTYAKNHKGVFVALRAVIKENQVTMTGYYSLRKLDEFGYTGVSKDRKRIIYTPGSQSWNIMLKVSREISSNLAFSE